MEKGLFAAGCFWGVEAAFRRVPGVDSTSVGYSGGSVENPTYEQVCTGNTGHAEVVEVTFDPEKVSYTELLEVFWSCHDPTTPNRQGPDVGTQYRSALFFLNLEQEAAACTSVEQTEMANRFPRPIVTKIAPAGPYYLAEDTHQQYFEKRGIRLSGMH